MIKWPAKVYILDDDQMIIDWFVAHLSKIDKLKVRGFTDTEKAMAAIFKDPCHILITDIHMPGLSGAEIVKDCARMHQGIQVIVISADDSFETAKQCFLFGAHDILSKPLNKKEVFPVIDRCLQQLLRWSYILDERKSSSLPEKIRSFLPI